MTAAPGGTAAAVVTLTVLASAFCHAGWNALAHRLPDKYVSFSWLGVGYALICAPLTVLAPPPAAAAWPYLLTSAALHVAYSLLLMQSYRLGEFNQVYPLARGTSPLLVALAAVLLVGERLNGVQVIGVVIVSVGLTSLVVAGGLPSRRQLPAMVASVGTGVAIAAYTVIDGIGVRRSGSALGYTAWLLLFQAPGVPVYAIRRRGRALWTAMRPYWRSGLCAGALSVLAYGLVLWAQTRGALAAVAALRESSVIIGAAIGAVWFHERFGRPRLVATVLVTAGIVLLNAP